MKLKLAVASVDKSDIRGGCVRAIEQAAGEGADLVLLPEEPDILLQMQPGQYTLEDHPIYQELTQAAGKAGIAFIVTLCLKVADGYANTSIFTDADGSIIGQYRKKHPAPSEEAIVTDPIQPGEPFPVFTFKGVKIGLAICMDIHFPEMFRVYGLKGVDLVCLSTMYMDYTGDMLESIEKSRAIDNQMYLAVSRYIDVPYLAGKSMGYAKVFAPDGRIIASTGHRSGITVVTFDPKWRFPFWAEGELRERYPDLRIMFDTIRRPDLYGELTDAE